MTGIPNGIPTFPNGRALLNGSDVQKLADQRSTGPVIVAKAGGGKTSATQITACNVILGTVATAADSVKLPPGYPGLQVIIANDGAESAQVFGSGTDTINDVATGTGVAQAAGLTAMYFCFARSAAGVGRWFRLLSA